MITHSHQIPNWITIHSRVLDLGCGDGKLLAQLVKSHHIDALGLELDPAKIATCLGEAGVSIDQMRQYGHEGTLAPVLIVTHKATRADIDHAMSRFDATGVMAAAPVAIRIEEV